MANCSRCGTSLGEYSAGGLCSSCSSLADAENVQCQRCGMYLPSHELKMLNSRLYCAYCIMDVQDEIERQRKMAEQPAAHEQPAAQEHPQGGSEHPQAPKIHIEEARLISPAEAVSASSSPTLEQYFAGSGTCERCGASALRLYMYKKRKMCEKCVKEEGGSIEPASSFFHKLHEIVASFFLFKKKNKREPSENQSSLLK